MKKRKRKRRFSREERGRILLQVADLFWTMLMVGKKARQKTLKKLEERNPIVSAALRVGLDAVMSMMPGTMYNPKNQKS